MKEKICECCKQIILIPVSTQKFCINCSIYTKFLRKKTSGIKSQLKILRIKIYGQKRGNERIR